MEKNFYIVNFEYYMQRKTPLKGLLFIVGSLVVISSFVSILFLVFALPANGQYYTHIISAIFQQSPNEIASGLPVRLKISKINVDAPIKYVGINAIGAMDLSKGLDEVSWYNLGPRPGEEGSAVIAGHYGIWKNGTVSVFQDLNTLVKGDQVSVEDDTGKIVSFIVRETKLYKKDANTSEVFLSHDGKSHLNFITCVWDKVSKTYAQRLVVFTDRQIK